LPAITPDPAPTPSQSVVAGLPESGNELFPGRYTTHFEPALMLTIDRQVRIDCAPGYRCRGDVDVNTANWLNLEFGHDHPIEIHVMRFDQVYDPKHAGRLIAPPEDLAAWVSAYEDVTVIDRTSVEVGGIEAVQLDLRLGSQDMVFGPTGLADPSALGFGAHQLHRVIVARVHGAAVVFGLGSVNGEDRTPERLAAAADILQPIVDSITWQ
jgi:hypothetical protein